MRRMLLMRTTEPRDNRESRGVRRYRGDQTDRGAADRAGGWWGGIMIALGAVCALCLGATQLYAEDYRVEKLANGLTLVHAEMNFTPLVTVEVLFHAGAMTESSATDGLTHLLEHMILNGNALIPDDKALDARMRALGSVQSNARTGVNFMSFFRTFPSVVFDEVLTLMASTAINPALTQASLYQERKVVLDEFNRVMDRPYFESLIVVLHNMYGNSMHASWPLGLNKQNIAGATQARLRQLAKEVMAPSNTTILVLGNVSYDQVKSSVEKYFGVWKDPVGYKKLERAKLLALAKESSRWNTANRRNNGVQFIYRYRGPSYATEQKDLYSATMFESLVNSKIGKFYKKYVQSGQWNEGGVYADFTQYAPEALLYGKTDLKSSETALQELQDEVKLWAQEGYFSQQNLEDVRRSLIVGRKIAADSLDSFMGNVSYFARLEDPAGYRQYREKLSAVTLADVRQFVKDYLLDQPYVLAVNYNDQDAQKASIDLNGNAYFDENFKDKVE